MAKAGYSGSDAPVLSGLASGADPGATFPNDRMARPQQPASPALGPSEPPRDRIGSGWTAATKSDPVTELSNLVLDTNWADLFAQGDTKFQVEAAWSATKERCDLLKCFVQMASARRVLEVGAFCGVATLAMSEALPDNGQILSVEIDPYLVEFGNAARVKSKSGSKISHIVKPAMEALDDVIEDSKKNNFQAFDFVLIDADKNNLAEYFNKVWQTPGLLSPVATVCVDVTPFKGQPPDRYVRFGQADQWKVPSGQEQIDAFRTHLLSIKDTMSFNEFSGILVVHRKR